jgi:hypothetical protein
VAREVIKKKGKGKDREREEENLLFLGSLLPVSKQKGPFSLLCAL